MATEAGLSHALNRKLGVVILGASSFPNYPPSRELDNGSFARSAAAFRGLMADESATVFGKPAILDLFDVDDDPISIIRRVQEFLKSEPALTDILFYYCGHGAVLSDHTYYLALKATDPESEAFTGLQVRQMRLALEVQLMRKRVFLVFDCCFAGKAAREWMATGIGQVIEEEVLRSFPRQGLGLIAASARNKVAVAGEREPRTMFTGTLIDTISTGVAGEKRELSFRDIVDEVRTQIANRYGSAGVAPEIHAPWQGEGDITFTPFFVNRAFVAPPETKAERETFELAVADLDRPLLRTRVGAVETLAELLSSTRSAAFRAEILDRLKLAQKEDDSLKIRAKCESVLARLSNSPNVDSTLTVFGCTGVDNPIARSGPGKLISMKGIGGSGGATNKIDEPMRRKDVAFFFRSHTVELCSILSTFLIAIALLDWFYVPAPSSCRIAVATLAFPSIFGILASISAIYYFINIKKRPILIRAFFVLSIVSLIFGVYTLHKAYEILPLCREFT